MEVTVEILQKYLYGFHHLKGARISGQMCLQVL